MSQLGAPLWFDVHRQVEELFEELIYRRWAVAGHNGWCPALDLFQLQDAYLVEIDLPGVPPEAVQILVGERTLTVSGERPFSAPEGVLTSRCERPRGAFRRAVTLPEPIDPRHAHAECRHGTYRILLPRRRAGSEAAGATPAEAIEAPQLLRVTVL